ncbi:hypothetical protein JAAARDRAFT_31884 [Jaapia argillacea MUCL 33604]|uniref:EF-hand domain-containing protein n=1 Tax=Jaapia argillacea MUCL 33604 TaxID=933084 RepID=A0A067QBJ1_9AGAM|nr:hypothetical protein JAAARDRAFT_31884 [Jaapia argillacea MUCL 33604]
MLPRTRLCCRPLVYRAPLGHPAGLPRPRFASSTPPASGSLLVRRSIFVARWCGYLLFSSTLGLVALTGAFFVHDAFTYTDKHVDRVPVSPLALNPERGGPKNLPIASALVGDIEDDFNRSIAGRPRLVIVGGGWGAVGVLQSLKPGDYHVTIVSPETFATFTPLLPSAAVGTVQARTLVEPLRKIVARIHGHFIAAKAVDLVMNEKLLEIETISSSGEPGRMYLPYDKLVISVGSTSATHGVSGLEHCFQLKTISDARAIRRRIIDNFETASLPTTSVEDRKRLLSFVICGGGPTGVESAAEIWDLCQEDLMNYYPKLLREQVSIHVIQSREHILNTYSESIWNYAEAKFKRDGVNLVTSARVSEVHPDKVVFTSRNPQTSTIETYELPTNFVLWSTGIAMNPFTQRLSSLLPNQTHLKAIEVDSHLRVKGAPVRLPNGERVGAWGVVGAEGEEDVMDRIMKANLNGGEEGEVYAIGDCATIETSLVPYLLELVEEADRDKNGKIDFGEWEIMVNRIKLKMPMAEKHLDKVRELFQLYDSDKDESLTLNELTVLLQEIGNKITALPATAQVAAQQGKYLGSKFTKYARAFDHQREAAVAAAATPSDATDSDTNPATTSSINPATTVTSTTSNGSHTHPTPILPDESISKPFRYSHLGSLAYIGNAAVFDWGQYSFTGGLAAMYAWRSVYWSEQVSARTRALLMIDWVIRGVWGRDLSRL